MIHQASLPVVSCPGCKLPMIPEATESAPVGLNKTTYRCAACGTKTDRVFKLGEKQTCVYRILDSAISVVKAAENWV
jgi:hypothetical protein